MYPNGFKRYQRERGTDEVCRIVENKGHSLFISAITIIEVVSNLKRLFEVDRLTVEEQFHFQRSFFYQDLRNLGMTIVDISPEVIIKADALILQKYMKPVDSIQLAVALHLEIEGLVFMCSDQALCDVAEREGLAVLNPDR